MKRILLVAAVLGTSLALALFIRVPHFAELSMPSAVTAEEAGASARVEGEQRMKISGSTPPNPNLDPIGQERPSLKGPEQRSAREAEQLAQVMQATSPEKVEPKEDGGQSTAWEKETAQALLDLHRIKTEGAGDWKGKYLGRGNLAVVQGAEMLLQMRPPKLDSSFCQLDQISAPESGRILLERYLERSLISPSATITGTLTALALSREIQGAGELVIQLAPLCLLESTSPQLARTCIALYLGGRGSNG